MHEGADHRYREIFLCAGVPLWELDLGAQLSPEHAAPAPGLPFGASAILSVNDAALAFLEVSNVGELLASLDRVFPVAPRPNLLSEALAAVTEGQSHAEADVVLGTLRGNRVRARLSFDRLPPGAPGTPLRAVLTMIPATGTEAQLEESESRFRTMADSAPVLLWMAGTDADCDFFNKVWLEFTGRPMEKELGAGWADGIHFEDFQHCMHVYMSSFVQRTPFKMEYRLRRRDGEYRWILDTGIPRFAPDGTFAGFVGSCVDISELKELQSDLNRKVRDRTSALEAALAERETLLHEVHHRVKNNLQVISSLLHLQARHLDDAHRDAFEETHGRIRSIALVHDRLYRSRDLARVDFAEYVRSLCRHVAHTFGEHSERIAIRVDIGATTLKVDQAIPCGLIINELLTNALKYAFPDGRRGMIEISLQQPEQRVVMEVKDDGVGLPADLDVERAPSLGLSLVATLTKQLDGDLRVRGVGGASFTISFEVEK